VHMSSPAASEMMVLSFGGFTGKIRLEERMP
jgi:hypothetical protein